MKIKRQKGFTLIELLIATAIFLTVITTIYSAFHSGIFGLNNIEESLNIQQASQQVLQRLNTDLRNAFSYSSEQTKFSAAPTEISFFTLTDAFLKDKMTQQYSFVSYKLENNMLWRLCRTNKQSLNDTSQIQYEEMAGQIEGMAFSYGYINPEDKSLVFKQVWDEPNVFPSAVKVKLSFKNKVRYDFERTIFF